LLLTFLFSNLICIIPLGFFLLKEIYTWPRTTCRFLLLTPGISICFFVATESDCDWNCSRLECATILGLVVLQSLQWAQPHS